MTSFEIIDFAKDICFIALSVIIIQKYRKSDEKSMIVIGVVFLLTSLVSLFYNYTH